MRQLPRAVPQRVFQPDAHIAAHGQRLGGNRHLVAPGTQHRPQVVVTEQAVRGALHVQHVFRVRPDAAEQAEYGLDQKRWFDQPALNKVRCGVQVADVVALDFKTGTVIRAGLQNVGDVFEGVFEHAVVAVRQIGPLPRMLEFWEALEHAVQAKVHRAHIERGHFRLVGVHRHQPLGHQHGGRATGGDVDHHIAGRFDLRQKVFEQRRVL